MSTFDALSGPDSSSGFIPLIDEEQQKILMREFNFRLDEKAAFDYGIDPQELDIFESIIYFNDEGTEEENPKIAKYFDDAQNIDKKNARPGHLLRKKGEKKIQLILPENIVKNENEWEEIEFYKGGKKVASINTDNFKIKSYTKDQLITVSRIFQKNLEEYINKLKELKKEEEKRKKAIEKERKAGYIKLTGKTNRNSKIKKKLNDKQSETASKTNYISQRIMEENGRQYERIIKKRRKIDDEFHDELIEIKKKTEEIHELRKEEDIKYKIDEKYGRQ